MSEYEVVMLYGMVSPGKGGAALSIADTAAGNLTLYKHPLYGKWSQDTTPLNTALGTRPKCEADRAYIHYIVDCWLDDVPVKLQPGEV